MSAIAIPTKPWAKSPQDRIIGLTFLLAAIAFSFDEEKNLNILKVLEKVRASFNSDEVTNKFYKEFEDNQKSLADEIKGKIHRKKINSPNSFFIYVTIT